MTRLLVLPGDGIGPEVTQATIRVLETLVPDVTIEHGLAGRQALAERGQPLAPETERRLAEDSPDGILFGATETRPGEPSAVLALRQATGARLSIRPARSRQSSKAPVDVTVYRELTEDLYVQQETTTEDGAVAQRPITEAATRRFAELAFQALPDDATPVVAHKATVLPATDGLFLETIQAVAQAAGRQVDDRLVDALAHDLAVDASGPLHILAPNLYGDLLSDLIAGLAGGLGVAPSLTLGDGPPIAEPVHGTAPDIAGQDIANPAASLSSAAMLLDHLGHTAEAETLGRAIAQTLAAPDTQTPDLGGRATTDTVVDAVLSQLEVVAR